MSAILAIEGSINYAVEPDCIQEELDDYRGGDLLAKAADSKGKHHLQSSLSDSNGGGKRNSAIEMKVAAPPMKQSTRRVVVKQKKLSKRETFVTEFEDSY